jgi:hypothetical protein
MRASGAARLAPTPVMASVATGADYECEVRHKNPVLYFIVILHPDAFSQEPQHWHPWHLFFLSSSFALCLPSSLFSSSSSLSSHHRRKKHKKRKQQKSN